MDGRKDMSLLDMTGMTVEVSSLPESIIVRFLRNTAWDKNKDTFYGKYIRPWMQRKQTRIFDAMYLRAQLDVQMAVMNKVIEEGEKVIDGFPEPMRSQIKYG